MEFKTPPHPHHHLHPWPVPRVHPNPLLQKSQILSCFGKLTLFHSLSDIPMHEGSLRIHHIVLLADSLTEHSGNGSVVSNHHHVPLELSQFIILHRSSRLLIQTHFETGWYPLHEAHFFVRLCPLNRGISFLRLDISSIIDRDGHIFILFGIKISNFCKEVLGGKARLSDSLNVIPRRFLFLLADFINGLVVQNNRNLGMIQQPMRSQQSIVWLHNACRDRRRWIHFKSKLRFLPVINSNPLQNKGTETRSSSSSHRVVHHKSLDIIAIIHQLPQPIIHFVDHLLSHSVVTAGKVVGCVFFSRQQKVRVENGGIFAVLHIVNHIRLQIHHQVSWHILSRSSLLEKAFKSAIIRSVWVITLRSHTVLSTILLPNGLTQLDTALSHTDRQNFSHHLVIR